MIIQSLVLLNHLMLSYIFFDISHPLIQATELLDMNPHQGYSSFILHLSDISMKRLYQYVDYLVLY